MTTPAKDRLVETALQLFHGQGFHATGIDKILAVAGVSKMTLYKHFPSKEALILEVLRVRDQRFRQWMADRTAALAQNPKDRLLAVFDALGEWFDDPGFHGCLFINASAEYGSPEDKIHAYAGHHKDLVVEWLADLCTQAGAVDPQALAWDLMLIMEGAIVVRQAAGAKDAAIRAKHLANSVIVRTFAFSGQL